MLNGRVASVIGIILVAARLGAQPPATAIHKEYAAINRHDLAGVFSVYSDTLMYGDLVDTVLPHRTTRATLEAGFAPFLRANPKGHVTVTHEVDVGPYVIAVENMSGAGDGNPDEMIDISEVQKGLVVSELETGNVASTPAAEVHAADSLVRAVEAAFSGGDPNTIRDAYQPTVLFHVWGEDSIQHLTPDKIIQGFFSFRRQNPKMKYTAQGQAASGPYVIIHERVTGMADGSRLDAFAVMLVRGGRIVAEWESPWLRGLRPRESSAQAAPARK